MKDIIVARAWYRFTIVRFNKPLPYSLHIYTRLLYDKSINLLYTTPDSDGILLRDYSVFEVPLGAVIVDRNDKIYIVKDGCKTELYTRYGVISAENLCKMDINTLKEIEREIMETYGIKCYDLITAALYYSAKLGLARFLYNLENLKKFKDTIELHTKLRELAKTIPPDQELEVDYQ